MASPSELEDQAARFCHLYWIHSPVNPRTIALAQDLTVLPAGSVPPRAVRGREPIYHCSGRRGRCVHRYDGCDERDQAWEIMLQLAQRELRHDATVAARHIERFARAVILPADEFLEDVSLCRRSVSRLLEVHLYVPERVLRERLADLGRARLSLVVATG